jgi:hypothetical protein
MTKLQENRSLGRLGMMGRDGEGWTCAKSLTQGQEEQVGGFLSATWRGFVPSRAICRPVSPRFIRERVSCVIIPSVVAFALEDFGVAVQDPKQRMQDAGFSIHDRGWRIGSKIKNT